MGRTHSSVKHRSRKREQEGEKLLEHLADQVIDKPEPMQFGDCSCGGKQSVVVRSGGHRLFCHSCCESMWLDEPVSAPPAFVISFG